MEFIQFLIQWLILAMILWIVLSYVVTFGRIAWGHPVRKIYDALSKVIEPMLRPIRKVVPPLRIGGAGIDLAPLILIIGLQILSGLLGS